MIFESSQTYISMYFCTELINLEISSNWNKQSDMQAQVHLTKLDTTSELFSVAH